MNENEQKQVQEMAKIIDETQCIDMTIEACRAETLLGNSCGICKAKRLYSKGYRKVERGEWIPITSYLYGWRCSLCENEIYSPKKSDINRYKYPFCPNCGADMRGEENEILAD